MKNMLTFIFLFHNERFSILVTIEESSTTKAELEKYQVEYERLRAENNDLRESMAQQV